MTNQAFTPTDFPKGTTVRVVKGRKVEHGTTGDVFWAGWDKFKEGSVRLGIKVDGETVWASDWMVEVVGAETAPEPEQVELAADPMSDEDWEAMHEDGDPEPYEVAHGPRDDSPFDDDGSMECPF